MTIGAIRFLVTADNPIHSEKPCSVEVIFGDRPECESPYSPTDVLSSVSKPGSISPEALSFFGPRV